MRLLPKTRSAPPSLKQQHGVVLFFALFALLAMSLAAVALIRSVDTATLIAGNLSFKRAATTSGDAGIEAAINWLTTVDAANSTLNVTSNPAHPFNITGGTGSYTNPGYYSNFNPGVSLTGGAGGIQWNISDSAAVPPDNSGNTVRYIIQRMCRTANTALSNADCLLSDSLSDNFQKQVKSAQEACPSCPPPSPPPQYRITSRTVGPKFTLSYTQAFVY